MSAPRSALPVVIVAGLLGACATAGEASRDYYGNVYPADCPASIVHDATLRSRVVIIRGTPPSGTYGATVRGGAFVLVVLSDRLTGWMVADIERHELCHAKHMLDGNPDNGDWHAKFVPNVHKPNECPNTFHC